MRFMGVLTEVNNATSCERTEAEYPHPVVQVKLGYWMSYSVRIICHLAILPDKVGFSKIYLIGSIFDINRVV